MNKILAYGFLVALTYHSFALPVVDEVQTPVNNSCHVCEEIVGVISKDVNVFNKTITDIIVVIRDICSDIPGPSGKECIYILDNIQQIIKWIMEGMTPGGVCHKLGFCNTTFVSCGDEF
tara:strand:- start:539 stop:895 length:357 start_codon:yes stop_codon:yes gene_type:complete